jgi:hypothetical protein
MDDIVSLAESLAMLAYVGLNRGDYAQALDTGSQALEIFRKPEFEDRPWQVHLTSLLALAILEQGELDRAAALAEESVALGGVVGDSRLLVKALMALGDVRCRQGAYEAALDAYMEGFERSVGSSGRVIPAMWQHALQGMASCAILAAIAFPDEPAIAGSLIARTDALCRQIGVGRPDSRLAYDRIRRDHRYHPRPARGSAGGSGTISDLRATLDDVRGHLSQLRQMLERTQTPSPAGAALLLPDSRRDPRGRDALAALLTPVQLSTIQRIAGGQPVKAIAAADGVAGSTVYDRIELIRRNWGFPSHVSLLDLAVFAVRNDLA